MIKVFLKEQPYQVQTLAYPIKRKLQQLSSANTEHMLSKKSANFCKKKKDSYSITIYILIK